MKPTHIIEVKLLYSKSTDLNVNLIQNTLTETSRIMFGHVSGHHGPATMTHKINHHGGNILIKNKAPAYQTFSEII